MKDNQGGNKKNEKGFCITRFYYNVRMYASFSCNAIRNASAKLADGTYDINYVIQKAENDSASMANDYFEKPAKLIVKNGEMRVQVPMNHSAWITEFKAPQNEEFC